MDDKQPNADDLPTDSHLQEDISLPPGDTEETEGHFAPGQTNAGQQVSGLASATDYNANQGDPESGDDANNPV